MTPRRGTPIVLVGGAGEDAEIWEDVCELLDARARVHELPGHGARGGEPLPTVEDMAADVLAACEVPSVLVGHSLGGAVAVSAALRAPDLVAGAVAVSAGARMPVAPALLDLLPDAFDDALRIVVAASTGGRGGRVAAGREHVAARMDGMLRRGGAALFASGLSACAAFDVRDELPHLRTALEVLVGERDRMTPTSLATELAEAGGGELHVLPDCGHQVPWEQPGAVAEAAERLADHRRKSRP